MVLLAILDIFNYLVGVLIMLMIVQFILGLLVMFNVVNTSNQFVGGLWRGLDALLEPMYRPIRRILPPAGGMDFSPMVLIVLLTVLQKVLAILAIASVR